MIAVEKSMSDMYSDAKGHKLGSKSALPWYYGHGKLLLA